VRLLIALASMSAFSSLVYCTRIIRCLEFTVKLENMEWWPLMKRFEWDYCEEKERQLIHESSLLLLMGQEKLFLGGGEEASRVTCFCFTMWQEPRVLLNIFVTGGMQIRAIGVVYCLPFVSQSKSQLHFLQFRTNSIRNNLI